MTHSREKRAFRIIGILCIDQCIFKHFLRFAYFCQVGNHQNITITKIVSFLANRIQTGQHPANLARNGVFKAHFMSDRFL